MKPIFPRKGRGALSNPDVRYKPFTSEPFDDGWGTIESEPPPPQTEMILDTSRTVINRNSSPDVPHDQSINPYRGCSHGCIYCFARPTHAYLDLSPGLDFETKILMKPDAAALLKKELSKKNYRCLPIAMGTNTDPYQPAERDHCITRQILEVLWVHRHPVSIVTKSSLIERDLDLLGPMAQENLALVYISVTTLENGLWRKLEPRTSAPAKRLKTIQRLTEAGIPTGALAAPLIPALNDSELEKILEESASAGALWAGYQVLRLPLEVKGLFQEWLEIHFPTKATHVMNLVRELHGGKEYDARFGKRMTGSGLYAEMIRKRFQLACKRLGLNRFDFDLDTQKFKRPKPETGQQRLFEVE